MIKFRFCLSIAKDQPVQSRLKLNLVGMWSRSPTSNRTRSTKRRNVEYGISSGRLSVTRSHLCFPRRTRTTTASQVRPSVLDLVSAGVQIANGRIRGATRWRRRRYTVGIRGRGVHQLSQATGRVRIPVILTRAKSCESSEW